MGEQLGLIFVGRRGGLRPVDRAGLRVADRLGQHLTQLSLRLRWYARDRCLPVGHELYVGMPGGESNRLKAATN
jgi:hypothetical protein